MKHPRVDVRWINNPALSDGVREILLNNRMLFGDRGTTPLTPIREVVGTRGPEDRPRPILKGHVSAVAG